MSTAKEEVESLLDKLPDDCSVEDIQYHLYVMEKVRHGLDAAAQVDVFFYGLFMDEAVLRGKGLRPEGRRVASLEGFRLVIGERATLVPRAGSVVYGVLCTLTRGEVDALYAEESVSAYRPEVVSARASDGGVASALCFNLPEPPADGERNPLYASKLRELAGRIGLPADYVSSIG